MALSHCVTEEGMVLQSHMAHRVCSATGELLSFHKEVHRAINCSRNWLLLKRIISNLFWREYSISSNAIDGCKGIVDYLLENILVYYGFNQLDKNFWKNWVAYK